MINEISIGLTLQDKTTRSFDANALEDLLQLVCIPTRSFYHISVAQDQLTNSQTHENLVKKFTLPKQLMYTEHHTCTMHIESLYLNDQCMHTSP